MIFRLNLRRLVAARATIGDHEEFVAKALAESGADPEVLTHVLTALTLIVDEGFCAEQTKVSKEGPPEEKFWPHVQKGEGDACWLWTGYVRKKKQGYGAFMHGGKYQMAHRFSYELHTGDRVPPDEVVMHSCDNPRCVNPAHLSRGTHGDNTADKVAKGRHARGPILSAAIKRANELRRQRTEGSESQRHSEEP